MGRIERNRQSERASANDAAADGGVREKSVVVAAVVE